jgi:hypothetical protein
MVSGKKDEVYRLWITLNLRLHVPKTAAAAAAAPAAAFRPTCNPTLNPPVDLVGAPQPLVLLVAHADAAEEATVPARQADS